MDIKDINKIVILIELKKGNIHQVLTSRENKEIVLRIIASADNGLKVDKELEPIEFKEK